VTRQIWLAVWAAIGAGALIIEAVSVATRRRVVGFAETLRSLTWGNVGAAVLFVAWMWLGWHVFAR
jgi:hypothetical protein